MKENGTTDTPHDFSAGWVIGSAFAALLGFTVALFQHPRVLEQPAPPNAPELVKLFLQVVDLINQPPFLLVATLVVLQFVIRRRFQGIQSLAGSYLIAGITTHLVRIWVFH